MKIAWFEYNLYAMLNTKREAYLFFYTIDPYECNPAHWLYTSNQHFFILCVTHFSASDSISHVGDAVLARMIT